MKTITTDPIVAEVRAARDAHAARFDYDLKKIFVIFRNGRRLRDENSSHIPLVPSYRRNRGSDEGRASPSVRAMEKGKHSVIPYFWGKVMVWMNRLSPSLMDGVMSRYV